MSISMDFTVKDWDNTYTSWAKYILNRKAVAESIAEVLNRMVKYFSLSFVGVSPKTDRFPFSKSQISTQESVNNPIICIIYVFTIFTRFLPIMLAPKVLQLQEVGVFCHRPAYLPAALDLKNYCLICRKTVFGIRNHSIWVGAVVGRFFLSVHIFMLLSFFFLFGSSGLFSSNKRRYSKIYN